MRAIQQSVRSIGRLARLLLIAAPPLLIGFLILRDGVDTPLWDEWDGTAPFRLRSHANPD